MRGRYQRCETEKYIINMLYPVCVVESGFAAWRPESHTQVQSAPLRIAPLLAGLLVLAPLPSCLIPPCHDEGDAKTRACAGASARQPASFLLRHNQVAHTLQLHAQSSQSPVSAAESSEEVCRQAKAGIRVQPESQPPCCVKPLTLMPPSHPLINLVFTDSK